MNYDTQRSFFFRLGIVSLIGAISWHILVGAKLEREQELKRTFASQTEAILQGEQEIERHADQLETSIERMQKVRDEMITHLDMVQSSKVHQILQDAAESYDLTVSRVEPVRMQTNKRVRKSDQSEIELGISEFRIECEGSYGGLVGFISELSNGTHLAKVGSFRIIPISNDSARMNIQVSVYQFAEAPAVFFESFKVTDTKMDTKMTDAGGLDDET